MVDRFGIFKKVVIGLRNILALMLGNPFINFVHLFLLNFIIEFKVGLILGSVFVPSIVKEGHEVIVLFILKRVIGMAMALYAANGCALPYLKGCIYPVYHGCYPKLFVVCTAFVIVHRISMECRGNQLIGRRVGQ